MVWSLILFVIKFSFYVYDPFEKDLFSTEVIKLSHSMYL